MPFFQCFYFSSFFLKCRPPHRFGFRPPTATIKQVINIKPIIAP